MRLTAIVAAFTLLGVGAFAWLQIDDSLDAARTTGTAQAQAAIRAQTSQRPPVVRAAGASPSAAELGASLGIVTVVPLDTAGEALSEGRPSVGSTFTGVVLPTEPGTSLNYDVRLDDETYGRAALTPLDLLLGGQFGIARIEPAPTSNAGPAGAAPGAPRAAKSAIQQPTYMLAVLEYSGISDQAQTLFLRSLVLCAAILGVAAMSIWVLLDRFVAKPLASYSTTANRIASGEVATMPDLRIREFDQLGQTIDEMATTLRQQATVDALTGLYNRRHLLGSLRDKLEDGQELTLLVCDLNNLKPINDTLGHAAGDVVLRSVARRMLAWGNTAGGTCWRTGGDEFAVSLPGVAETEAGVKLRSLTEAVETPVLEIDGKPVRLSISIGSASFPIEAKDMNSLLALGDERMYEAKTQAHRDREAA